MKNSNDTIGNQTSDLPACSAVPQPTAPSRALINNNDSRVIREETFVLSVLSVTIKYHRVNLKEPCVLYIGRAYSYTVDVAFYIYFFQQI